MSIPQHLLLAAGVLWVVGALCHLVLVRLTKEATDHE